MTNSNNGNRYPRFNPLHDQNSIHIKWICAAANFYNGSRQQQYSASYGNRYYGYGNYGIGFFWSPDGSNLLYSYNDKLFKIISDGSNLALIVTAPQGRIFRGCSYSLDGSKIAVLIVGSNTCNSKIYLMNSNGSNMIFIVDNSPGQTASPLCSVDGQEILVTNDIPGYQGNIGRQLNVHIFKINISTKDIVDLSYSKPNGTNDLNPRFSSNGAYLIMVLIR